jgi:hypothetical protein
MAVEGSGSPDVSMNSNVTHALLQVCKGMPDVFFVLTILRSRPCILQHVVQAFPCVSPQRLTLSALGDSMQSMVCSEHTEKSWLQCLVDYSALRRVYCMQHVRCSAADKARHMALCLACDTSLCWVLRAGVSGPTPHLVRCTVGQASVGQASVGQASVGQASVAFRHYLAARDVENVCAQV